jgi:hypothetical protein
MSSHPNARPYFHINVTDKSFGHAADFRCLETTVVNQNFIHKGIKNILRKGKMRMKKNCIMKSTIWTLRRKFLG